jgi:HEPN domain-containing protein
LRQIRPPVNDIICFHCQQASEKYLKGLLQEWDIAPPRTHDLVALLGLLSRRDAKLRKLRQQLHSLSDYAVDLRYPGDDATRRQALAAIRHAENVRQEIRARLGLSP